MDSQSSTIPSSPQYLLSREGPFPQEILGEFAEYLTEGDHRKDLLNLSLASKSLRKEAQRVLFRAIDSTRFDRWPVQMEEMITHRLFMRSIIDSPTRLAPHVRTYTSRFLALVPANSEKYDDADLAQSDDAYGALGRELWNLTSRALPLLTQLDHLTLFLGTDGRCSRKGMEPSPFHGGAILRRCRFTLDSFSWSESHGLQNSIGDLEEFLSRQPHLRSLNLNTSRKNSWYTDQILRFHLATTTLPCLRRVMGPSSLIPALLSKRRHIDTLFWLESWQPEESMLDDEVKKALSLQSVKCLLLQDPVTLKAISSRLSSVETLYLKEIAIFTWLKNISALTHLKSLRVLVLDIVTFNLWPTESEPTHDALRANLTLLVSDKAFDACANTLQSVHFLLPALDIYRLLSVEKSGQFHMQNIRDLSDVAQLFWPWIPREQPLWTDINDYFCWCVEALSLLVSVLQQHR